MALIRELGPMLAAILIAGRSGSAITAQIGVMRVTDELDAMRVMGISHSFRLVMPRAWRWPSPCPDQRLDHHRRAGRRHAGGRPVAGHHAHLLPQRAARRGGAWPTWCWPPAKSVVFGLLIALIGCHYGLRVKPNTQSLGRARRRRW
jgi:phospholipid/cholesterol/gamma-HCH transport system permease protein